MLSNNVLLARRSTVHVAQAIALTPLSRYEREVTISFRPIQVKGPVTCISSAALLEDVTIKTAYE